LSTQDTWRFINSFAPWFSALGTISAVLLAIHLARRDKTLRLEVSAGHRLIVTPGTPGPWPEYLSINIVNVGHREAQITNIGWKVGVLRKQHAIQTTINDGMSSPIPVRLRDGEEAKYLIPLNERTNWLEDFGTKMLTPLPWLQVRFIRVQVFTSIGKTFEAPIEPGLQKMLREAITQSVRP
jgi:hypothetical protein